MKIQETKTGTFLIDKRKTYLLRSIKGVWVWVPVLFAKEIRILPELVEELPEGFEEGSMLGHMVKEVFDKDQKKGM